MLPHLVVLHLLLLPQLLGPGEGTLGEGRVQSLVWQHVNQDLALRWYDK